VSAPQLSVRAATEDDVDVVGALEAGTLGADAWSPSLVAEGVRGALPTVVYLLAEADGEPVGHAVASLAGDVVELQRIGVLETARRAGAGSALLEAVDTLARGEHAERLLLEVREDNEPALAFYRAHGFAELARRPRYYGDGATAVVMERPVDR
jgi:ribosomal-protein-alanine N-acetyltransferase